MNEHPKGWTESTLGEVCIKTQKVNPQNAPDSVIPYLDIGGIDNLTFKVTETKTYTGADAPSRARQLVEEGDVLFWSRYLITPFPTSIGQRISIKLYGKNSPLTVP